MKDNTNILYLTESQSRWEFGRSRIYLLSPFSYLIEMFIKQIKLNRILALKDIEWKSFYYIKIFKLGGTAEIKAISSYMDEVAFLYILDVIKERCVPKSDTHGTKRNVPKVTRRK